MQSRVSTLNVKLRKVNKIMFHRVGITSKLLHRYLGKYLKIFLAKAVAMVNKLNTTRVNAP